MSGSYPLVPYFSSAAIEQDQPVVISSARSGRQKRRRHAGHTWLLKGSYGLHSAAAFLPVYAFLCDREGGLNNFTIVLNEHATPRGIASGSPVVNGASQTGKSLIIDGAGASVTGWLKAGDVLTIAGHTKVYMVTADCNSDSGGNVTIPIVPSLVESPGNNFVVTVSNVAFTMVLAENNIAASKTPPLLYTGRVSMVEDI